MFNPQRKAKISDILMQQKSFQLHLQKIRQIQKSSSPRSIRYEEEKKQERYLNRIHMSKQEVKERLENRINRQNHRLFIKLIQTDHRPEENPEVKIQRRHHNSYYSARKNMERIHDANDGIITRMINQSSIVPPLHEMNKEFKQSKRYARMIRKLPSILKHQQKFRHELSSKRFSNSKTTLHHSRNGSVSARTSSQQMNYIEKELIDKTNL